MATPRLTAAAMGVCAALNMIGCGERAARGPAGAAHHLRTGVDQRALALDPSYQPRRLGPGALYRPPATSREVVEGRVLHRPGRPALACQAAPGARFGVHLEVFAGGHVVAIPAGIGVAPPILRQGATVTGGRCSYPLRTLEPTGVVQSRVGSPLTLGDLFAVWGQPLSARRVAGFRASGRGRVRAYLGRRRWTGALRSIPLQRHAQIALEVGPRVPPHPSYLFAPGL